MKRKWQLGMFLLAACAMMYHLHVESSGQKAPFLLCPFLTAPAIAVLGETLPSSALTWRIGLAVLVLALAVKDTLERLLRVCSAPQEMDVDDVIFLVCSVGRSANAGVFSLLVAVEHLKFAQAASMMFGIAALNTSACAAALWIWTGGAATSYPPEGQTLPKTMLLVAVHTAMHLLAKPLLALLPLRLQPETQRTVVTLGELSTLDRTGRTEDAHAFGRMLTKRPSDAHRVVDAHGTVALGDACPPSGVLDSYVDDDDVDGRSDDLVGTAQDLVNAFATIANAQSQVGREQVAAAHRLDSIPPLLSEAATAVATAREASRVNAPSPMPGRPSRKWGAAQRANAPNPVSGPPPPPVLAPPPSQTRRPCTRRTPSITRCAFASWKTFSHNSRLALHTAQGGEFSYLVETIRLDSHRGETNASRSAVSLRGVGGCSSCSTWSIEQQSSCLNRRAQAWRRAWRGDRTERAAWSCHAAYCTPYIDFIYV